MTAEHVGEWRVSISGRTLEDVFSATARVIASAAGKTGGALSDWESVEVTARDPATLLVDWANELLGRSEVSGTAYTELKDVRVTRVNDALARVSAQLRGQAVQQWLSPIKAATYHGLSLENNDKEWRAEVLFDV